MFLFTRLAAEKRTFIVTLIVFSLSSGVVGGALFFIDNVAPIVFNEMVRDVGVDLIFDVQFSFYKQDNTSLADIKDTIEKQNEVLNVEVVQLMEGHTPDYSWTPFLLGVNQSVLDSFPDAIRLTSEWPILKDNECYVQYNYMTKNSLQVGDRVKASFKVYAYDYNSSYYYEQTVTLDLLIVGSFSSNLYPGGSFEGGQTSQLFAVVTTQTFNNIMSEAGLGYSFNTRHNIWSKIDLTSILETDPTDSLTHLENIRRSIEQTLLPYVSVSYYGYMLRNAVEAYMVWSGGIRLVAIGFSAPAIIMGIMIVYYYSALRADQQRRDTGTIKTRGASGRQSMFWILAEGILTTIIGSIAGLVVGMVVAALCLNVRTFMEFDFTRLGQFSITLQSISVIVVIGFALTIGMLVTLPRAINAFTVTPAAAHSQLKQEVLEHSEQLGGPLPYLLLFLFSIQFLLPLLLITVYYSIYGFSIVSLGLIVVMISVLILSVIRLGAAPAARLKAAVLRRFGRSHLSPITRVLMSSALLHKKTEALSVIFMSLLFTTCVFASVSASTAHNHTCELVMFSVGADMSVDVRPGLHNITLDLQDNISAIEGVDSVAAMLYIDANITYRPIGSGGEGTVTIPMSVYGVQPEEWLKSAFWLPYFTYYTSPDIALQQLVTNNSKVLSSFKPVVGYRLVGYEYVPIYTDDIRLRIEGPHDVFYSDCKIIDTLSSNGPAGGLTYLPGVAGAQSFVIVNIDYLHTCLNSTEVSKFYIRLSPDANVTSVMTAIREIAPFSFSNIQSSKLLIEENVNSRATQSIHGIYTMDVILSLIYLTVGMAAVLTMKIRTQSRQFAILRAIGYDTGSVLRGILIEIPVTLIHAGLLGSVPALILAYILSHIPLMYMGVQTQMMWLRLRVLLNVPIHILAVTLGSAVAVILLSAYVITRQSMSGVISEKIQFEE